MPAGPGRECRWASLDVPYKGSFKASALVLWLQPQVLLTSLPWLVLFVHFL